MVRLKVVSGKMAGTEMVARHFPLLIGRGARAQLRIEEAGVWDEHLEISFERGVGFVVTTRGSALAGINGLPVQHAALRNGDTIEFGSAKLQFTLAGARQSGLRFREWLVWGLIAAVSLGEVALIYCLIQ